MVRVVDEGDDPAVVLMRGPEVSAERWRDLVSLLSSSFRAIAPDVPPDSEPDSRLRDVLSLLPPSGSLAAVGMGEGADTALRLGLVRALEALVLLSPVATLSRPDLDRFDAPVLILVGEDDPSSAGAEALNEAIVTSSLGLLPGVGPDLLGEAGATVIPMVYEFLRARYLRAPHAHVPHGVVDLPLGRRPSKTDGEE
jgi:pimeloyl-ACP methyl ester carboxylesterase